MSYYPMLNAPGVSGWTTLSNFPPNNWEPSRLGQQFVNVTWACDGVWVTKDLAVVGPGAFHTVHADEIADIVSDHSLALLSLSPEPLPAESTLLPDPDFNRTSVPAWRATLGLSSPIAQTSYQGELDFFPPQGTLLTFGPFLQFGEDVQNHLLSLDALLAFMYHSLKNLLIYIEFIGKGRYFSLDTFLLFIFADPHHSNIDYYLLSFRILLELRKNGVGNFF